MSNTKRTELSSAKIEAGWHDTFSTSNPYCPCDLKSFTKAVRWAERNALAAPGAEAAAPGEAYSAMGHEWDWKTTHAELDRLGIPRTDAEDHLSLWGRVASALAGREGAAATPERLRAIIAAVPDIGDKAAREFTIAHMAAALARPAAQPEAPAVSRESAVTALHHLNRHNGPGRFNEAIAMLTKTTEAPAVPAGLYCVDDIVSIKGAISVFDDVLGDIADWEDKALAAAVTSARNDLSAIVESDALLAAAPAAPAVAPMLTDAAIVEACDHMDREDWTFECARAIEAAVRAACGVRS